MQAALLLLVLLLVGVLPPLLGVLGREQHRLLQTGQAPSP